MNSIYSSKFMWNKNKVLKKIFNLFGNNNIFFVGGAVRNLLLNEELEDIDLAVKFNSDQVKQKLKKNKIKFIDVSKGHGTVTVISKNNQIEITSMRVDKETYGRKAKVEFVEDIFLDSCRRDFTINSIYSNYDGKIYDPHNGISDLNNKMVKFIGKPKDRIKEDTLRVLRYFRFLSYFGCNKNIIHKESMLACLESIGLTLSLSKERKAYEFFKLIKGKYAADVLILMKNKQILKFLLPGIEKIKKTNFKILTNLKKEKLIRISFLIIMSQSKLDILKEHLLFSKKDFNEIKLLCLSFFLYEINNIKEARFVKFKLGRKIGMNLYHLKCKINKKNIRNQILSTLQYWTPPVFPIDGNDIKKMGFKKSQLLGQILKETKKWWISKDFKPNRKECILKSKEIIANSTTL